MRIILVLMLCTSWSWGQITYTLQKATNPDADQLDAYERITKAMDSALVHYNKHTTIHKQLNVRYNPGVPTAEANFDGLISFGKDRAYMVVITAMHEMGHTMGVGTTSEYRNFIKDGIFTGEHTTAAIREISGDATAVIKGDSQHFWPYGLNYAHEVKSEADLINHCKIVNAMWKDFFHEELYFTGYVRNKSTGQCMMRQGNDLIMQSCENSELLKIVSVNKDRSHNRLEFGDRVLDVPNESTAAGVTLGLYGWNGKNHQRFSLESQDSDSTYILRMVHNRLPLAQVGEQVQQVSAQSHTEAQKWELLSTLGEEPTAILPMPPAFQPNTQIRLYDLLGRQ